MMDIISDSARFEMLPDRLPDSKCSTQPRSIGAVLSVNRAQRERGGQKVAGWKAQVAFPHMDPKLRSRVRRLYGVFRSTIVEAVDYMIQKHLHRISETDARRLRDFAAAMQARRTANLGIWNLGSQPRSGPEPASLTDTMLGRPSSDRIQAHRHESCVGHVHQIYGLFGDDKPMSDLFLTSQRKWSEVAAGMGAQYRLWNAVEIETLMKHTYPEYWDMYCRVRYPIMRCDIARIAILHSFSGLYADLDTLPNRAWYEQADLAVLRVKVPRKKSVAGKATRLSAKKEQSAEQWTTHLDMEVIIGSARNAIFLDWLNYIREQIASKPYAEKSSFWHAARMRYVVHTTGLFAMRRFLKLPANAAKWQKVEYLECNYSKDAESLNENRKRVLDVISHQSKSYFTKEHEIHVSVGLGDNVFPPLPTKRIRVKSAVQRMGVSSVNKDGAEAAARFAVQAASQDNDAAQSEVSTAARADVDSDFKIRDSAADAVVKCETDLVTYLEASMTDLIDSLTDLAASMS